MDNAFNSSVAILLVVARSRYIDDGSRPNTEWALDRVLTNVMIDPAVFVDGATPPR